MIQSTLINVLALWIMLVDDDRRDMDQEERIWGYTGAAGMIQALAAGYFVWDLIVTSRNLDVFGLGTLAHAIAALLVYCLGFVGTSPPLLLISRKQPSTDCVTATLRQLLRLHLHTLGAFNPVPESSLVHGQARHDRVSRAALQWSHAPV